MESAHKSNTHRDIAAASLASLAATLAAIRAHAGDVHGDTQTSSHEDADQDDSSFDADGEQPPLMLRLMS
jgi:hypothetical protein